MTPETVQQDDQQEEIIVDQVEQEDLSADPIEQEPEEVVVTFGDEQQVEPEDDEEELNRAPEWVRNLRKSKKEADRRARELEREKQALAEELDRARNGGKPAEQALGEEPTLEGCDYDPERFKAEFRAWHDRKREVEAVEARRKAEEQQVAKAWQDKLESYDQKKRQLKVGDYADAESVVTSFLNVAQQGVILHGADSPELIVYALGKNPTKAKELAAIKDPVKFAFAVAKLETTLKVTPRRSPPPPEKEVKGSARISGAVDSELERLRNEAAKNPAAMQKLIEYKRKKRA